MGIEQKIKKQHIMRTRNSIIGFPGLVDDFLNTVDFSPLKGITKNLVNIHQTEDAYEVDLLAPGFSKGDFTIEIENQKLIVKAEVTETENTEGKRITTQEFKISGFERHFTLPKDQINEDEIKASYEGGILKISLPVKEKEVPKSPKKIEIF